MSDTKDFKEESIVERVAKRLESKSEVPIQFVSEEGRTADFVDRIVVQGHKDHIYISLYQTDPPFAMSEQEMDEIKFIAAYCKGKYVVTKETLRGFMRTLQNIIDTEER